VTLRAFKFRRGTIRLSAVAAVLLASIATFGVASGPSGASTGGLAAAKAFLARYTQIPTSIGVNVPLKKVPPRGVKVIFLNTDSATAATLNVGFIQAAKELGWIPTVVTYSATDPGAAVQSAIDEGYKYIASASISLSQITPEVSELQSHHVAFFESYTADTPGFKNNGLYGEAQDPAGADIEGQLMANYITVQSNQNANVLFVSLPIYPVLVEQGTAAQAELAQNCPTCTFTTLGVSVSQFVAGQTPSLIVTYLQTHPNINYLYYSFNGMDTGVYSALQTANLTSQVSIVGTEGEYPELTGVLNGQQAAWTMVPENYVMWVIVDWMARQSVGELNAKVESQDDAGVNYLVTTPTLAGQTIGLMAGNRGVWGGPTGYQGSFEKLWFAAKKKK
jgi:ribose transport system substrate-binding protein